MSALTGIFHRGGERVAPEDVDVMAKPMHLHGVDGYGRWCEGPIALAQQTMLESDFARAEDYPLRDEEAGLCLILDGRIYNRNELLTRLFPASDRALHEPCSDGALLLMCYRKWGEGCVDHLVGEFAFAIHDSRENKLFLACDHMGIRPLFFAQSGDWFFISSEIKGILAHARMQAALNHKQMARMAVPIANMLQKRETFYQGVYRLEGSHTLSVTRQAERMRCYWRPDPEAELALSDDDVFEHLREVAMEAVCSRLTKAHPVGAFLSGGLDSSTVTALAATGMRREGQRLTTFSAVSSRQWSEQAADERAFIQEFAHWPTIDQVFESDASRGPFDDLELLVRATETPMVSSRHFLYRGIFQAAASRGVRTLLDGGGGELSLSNHGAGILPAWFLRGDWFRLARILRQRAALLAISPLRAFGSEIVRPLLPRKLSDAVDRVRPGRRPRHIESTFFQPAYLDEWLGTGRGEIEEELARRMDTRRDHRTSVAMGIETARTLVMRLTGEFGPVSSSYPLLDKRLLEACLGVPQHLLWKNGHNRSLIRGSMGGMVPERIRWRCDKKPFSPDFHLRFNRQRPWVQEYLQQIPTGSPLASVIDLAALKRLTRHEMDDPRGKSVKDLQALSTLPLGIYTLAFLRQFPEFSTPGCL